jgi:putative membrane protein
MALAAAAGIAARALIPVVRPGAGGAGPAAWRPYLVGGLLGAAAMILPGIGGGDLLLLLGLYVPIPGAVGDPKRAIFGHGLDPAAQAAGSVVLIAVGFWATRAIGALGRAERRRRSAPRRDARLGMWRGGAVPAPPRVSVRVTAPVARRAPAPRRRRSPRR